MRGIVVYQSVNGSTKAYAEWLSQEMNFECRPVRQAGNLLGYDVIVLGSCVRAFKVTIGSWVRKNWSKIGGKNVVLFSVAGAVRTDPRRDEYLLASVGSGIAEKLPHFKLEGRMKYNSMRWIDRKLMQLFVSMTAKKDPEEAKKVGEEFDKVDRGQLSELTAYLAGLKRSATAT